MIYIVYLVSHPYRIPRCLTPGWFRFEYTSRFSAGSVVRMLIWGGSKPEEAHIVF